MSKQEMRHPSNSVTEVRTEKVNTALEDTRHETFAQALARGISAAAVHGQVGFKPHRA
jgi:hypothetical protein